jgi:hypothetical protein
VAIRLSGRAATVTLLLSVTNSSLSKAGRLLCALLQLLHLTQRILLLLGEVRGGARPPKVSRGRAPPAGRDKCSLLLTAHRQFVRVSAPRRIVVPVALAV